MKKEKIGKRAITYALFALLISVLLMSAGENEDIKAKDICLKSASVVEFNDIKLSVTLRIYNKDGAERVRKLSSVTKKYGEEGKMLLRFDQPADYKGTTMLIYDYETKSDDIWIYLPSLRKSRRIISSEKGKSFMGSEFSNSDMSKPSLNDFTYKILGSENIEGHDCWKIETIPNEKAVAEEYGFFKKISLIDKETFLCYKFETFDIKGVLIKTALLKQYRQISEYKYMAMTMEMKNEQNGRRSVINIDNYSEGVSLTESEFSPSKLEWLSTCKL